MPIVEDKKRADCQALSVQEPDESRAILRQNSFWYLFRKRAACTDVPRQSACLAFAGSFRFYLTTRL